MRVFVADDSKILRERMISMLTEAPGITCVGEAGDGEEACYEIAQSKPDVVILDIQMPKENGISVLKKIKKDHPSTIVIIFTNYPLEQYRNRCLDLGADFFFDKSTESEKPVQVLKRMARAGCAASPSASQKTSRVVQAAERALRGG
jgi:DNA-binding NarL/FixJ family response regulator